MRMLLTFMAAITLFACVANSVDCFSSSQPLSDVKASNEKKSVVSDPPKPIKSPHGYIITRDYNPGGFGGFIGDCSSDKNWPYYWQCMSENAGNGGLK